MGHSGTPLAEFAVVPSSAADGGFNFMGSLRSFAPLAGVAPLLATTLAAGVVRAGPTIGADLDLGFPLHSRGDSGGGFGIRLGQELHLPLVALVPELGFTYHKFSGDYGPKIYRGIAGLRLGIGEVIRPGVFAHLGIRHFVSVFGG